MIDHISVAVNDFRRSLDFYDAVLAAVGAKRFLTFDAAAGWMDGDGRSFWIRELDGEAAMPDDLPSFHIAFAAPGRAAVDAFYAAGLAAGGKDNGQPGLRPQYHENYYGAFLVDPDGYRIEAVCHRPVEA